MMAGGTLAGAGESGGRTLIYLARHGQTPLNESGVLRGLADPPLDETGRDQAQRLGARLGPLGLWAVISSPLPAHGRPRARQIGQLCVADGRHARAPDAAPNGGSRLSSGIRRNPQCVAGEQRVLAPGRFGWAASSRWRLVARRRVSPMAWGCLAGSASAATDSGVRRSLTGPRLRRLASFGP